MHLVYFENFYLKILSKRCILPHDIAQSYLYGEIRRLVEGSKSYRSHLLVESSR